MDRNEIYRKVVCLTKTILSENALNDAENMGENTKLLQGGLELSSLDMVFLIVKIEEFFGIQWPDELLAYDYELSIGEVIDIIEMQVK